MLTVLNILAILTQAIMLLVIIQFIIGLLFAFNVVSGRNDFLGQVYQSINALLDPILSPIRRVLPQTGAIDFSPMVLILGLIILGEILVGLAPLTV